LLAFALKIFAEEIVVGGESNSANHHPLKHGHGRRGLYGWGEYRDLWHGFSDFPDGKFPSSTIEQTATRLKRPLASETVGVDVFITLTTIHNRLHGIGSTIESLLEGEMLPTHIYVFLSEHPFLLDQGVQRSFLHTSATQKLRMLYRKFPHISIIFTDNIGSHRKLLPLLERKWMEDCAIVTVDDHLIYPKTMLSSLVHYDKAAGGNAVIARRSRRMGLCSRTPPWTLSPYTRNKRGLWPETKPARIELLMLPTGTGGVLYRPWYFNPIVFDEGLRNSTVTGDDLLFRLSTMANGIPVVTACSPDDTKHKCPKLSDIKDLLQTQISASKNMLDELFPSKTTVNARLPTSARRQGQLRRLKHSYKKKQYRRFLIGGKESSSVPDAKKESLATIYNNIGGNNEMWLSAVMRLKSLDVFDFEKVLQTLAQKERGSCLFSSSVLRDDNKKGWWGEKVHSAILGIQNFYDPECGIHTCTE